MKNRIQPRVSFIGLIALLMLAACNAAGPAHPAIPGAAPFAADSGVVSDSFPIPASIALWPGGAPGSEGKTGAETVTQRHEPATADTPDVTFPVVSNINSPSITPFLPAKSNATGAAVIVMPGGGHMFLSINMEGYDVAHYLSEHGVAAFVLKYRLARQTPSAGYQVDVEALMDTQRAIRLIRSRAAEFGIDPNRVGVMGFSAGGELAILSTTHYNQPVKGSDEPVDHLSCKPDFQALMYPGGLNDVATIAVDKDMPPAFLCCTYTDRSNISANLASYYLKLKAAGVPAELHIFNSGGHGWGTRPTGRPVSEWPDRFLDWMSDRGLLTSSAATKP